MSIFNSLGSNYDFSYVLKSLLSTRNQTNTKTLKKLLEQKYGGKSALFYKGREALTYALKILNLSENSTVAINGFTCVAVFNAIRTAGFEPVCLDLENNSDLNFSPEILEKALESNKNIKVVVIQNTLGYPCNIDKIQQICRKNNLILIEDLAHCVGTKYVDGREAGMVGDLVILSFSQDKIIDAVSGGALIVRNKKYINNLRDSDLKSPKNSVRDRLYPFFTYKIRTLYDFSLGKPYHFVVKNLGLLSNIMDESFYDSYKLPDRNAELAIFMFKKLDEQLIHRKAIAKIYASNLTGSILLKPSTLNFQFSTNLRFPIFVQNRTNLLKYLSQHRIYVSDIWYSDVAPDCPNAIADSKIILNLPTHINVSKKDAQRICDLINQWIRK